MTSRKSVLLIGIDPDLVDFSGSSSGRTAETVEEQGQVTTEKLEDLGYEVHSCVTDTGDTAEATVVEALSRTTFDGICIGAGIRALPEHTVLFEEIINAIHEHAPSTQLCFNTNPSDTVEAVQRRV